jgi:2-polyprenyl-3-methyl-5-hydroxy-6-metoxy-1,4-benzoquinol methylase
MTATANEVAIARWSAIPEEVLAAFDPEGDFGRRHLLNDEIFRLLGDVRGKRVLDAGCGQGYLSRLLADRGAVMVGVEPAGGMLEYAMARERERRQGIMYVQADLASVPDLGDPFDAVVSNVVFEAIPDWKPALRSCVKALRPGGTLVFSIEHPCFEDGRTSWLDNGCVEVREYLAEYERPRDWASDWHRTLSTYLNATIRAGCSITEVVEPGLDPDVVATGPPGCDAGVHVPNFLIVAAIKQSG